MFEIVVCEMLSISDRLDLNVLMLEFWYSVKLGQLMLWLSMSLHCQAFSNNGTSCIDHKMKWVFVFQENPPVGAGTSVLGWGVE